LIEKQEIPPMNDDTTIKQLCTWSALGVLGDALTRIQALYCDLFGQGGKNAFELAEVGKTLRHFAAEYRRAVQALSGTIESEGEEAETEDFELLGASETEEEENDNEF
jgi:hypothetical protein